MRPQLTYKNKTKYFWVRVPICQLIHQLKQSLDVIMKENIT